MKSGRTSGIITVYLSLILLIVLSLLTVMFESARTAAMRYIAQNTANLSVNSVLADYCSALYDRYHIFAKETGADTYRGKERFVNKQLALFLDKNLVSDGAYFWKFSAADINITECVSLMDYNGAFFRKEAVIYEEAEGVQVLVEQLLQYLGLFQVGETAAKIMEDQEEAQKEISIIDEKILALMENVDGIIIGSDGVETDKNGNIKINDTFVKKVYPGIILPKEIAVENMQLFDAVSTHYDNPRTYINRLVKAATKYVDNDEKIEDNRGKIEDINEKAEASKDKDELLELTALKKSLETENKKLLLQQEILINQFNEDYSLAGALLKDTKTACEKSLKILDEIDAAKATAKPKLEAFETALTIGKEVLDADLYEAFQEKLKLMKSYYERSKEAEDRVPDFDKVRETLTKDCQVLNFAISKLEELYPEASFAQSSLLEIDAKLAEYTIEGLKFDYSGLNLNSSEIDPLIIIKTLIGAGILRLVLPKDSTLSDTSYTMTSLPSKTFSISPIKADYALFAGGSIGAVLSESPVLQIKEIMAEESSQLTERFLYVTYLMNNFTHYGKKDSGLHKCSYELEYILSGNQDNIDNLEAVVSRILLLRVIFSLMSVMSDPAKTTEAEEIAAAVLGFTGVPVLVEIMKYSLLFVLAFDEALIETCAILKGKKVPIITASGNLKVSFAEVMLMTKDFIEKKAEQIPESKTNGLDYEGYLAIFLLLQKDEEQVFRTMDVIQENLRLSDDEFRMNHLLYGYNAEITFTLPAVFGTVQKIEKYKCIIPCGVSY